MLVAVAFTSGINWMKQVWDLCQKLSNLLQVTGDYAVQKGIAVLFLIER